MLDKELKRLFWLGLLAEALIFIYSFLQTSTIAESFRLSARYSGRLSLFYFVGLFLLVGNSWTERRKTKLRIFISLSLTFALLHFIHWIFLGLNVYLNEITLIPYKLAGGAVAYFVLMLYPFLLKSNKIPSWLDYLYFLYPITIFTITVFSRLRGGFEGSAPSPIHYMELGAILISVLFFMRKQLFAT